GDRIRNDARALSEAGAEESRRAPHLQRIVFPSRARQLADGDLAHAWHCAQRADCALKPSNHRKTNHAEWQLRCSHEQSRETDGGTNERTRLMNESATPIRFNPWDPDFRSNPYPFYKPLLEGPPRMIDLFGPVALVARFADVSAMLKDNQRFS